MAQQIDQLAIKNCQLSIQVKGLSKRFNREWIFKNFDYTFQSGKTYAITGPNGSGKSTLLQILWGQIPQSSGTIQYTSSGNTLAQEDVFKHVSIATPYMDLIEEFTLTEQIQFHFQLRTMRRGETVDSIIEKLYLMDARDKAISNFSSGMRHRLKLGLAFFTEAKALFLDEPGTNLDEKAFQWYLDNLNQIPQEKLIFIASNQRAEYPENAEVVDLLKLK
jgi:ABC-type multidrug transport system ATPase subunit